MPCSFKIRYQLARRPGGKGHAAQSPFHDYLCTVPAQRIHGHEVSSKGLFGQPLDSIYLPIQFIGVGYETRG